MSYRRVSRMALVVLIGVLVACTDDHTNPTQPNLGGLASLTGEVKPDNPGGGNGGGGQTEVDHSYLVSLAGYVIGTEEPAVNADSKEIRIIADFMAGAWLNTEAITSQFPDAANCFGSITNTVTQVFLIDEARGYRVEYIFDGRSKDGNKSPRYRLSMKIGVLAQGSWLPAQNIDPDPGIPAVVRGFDDWRMTHQGKGGKKGACLSEDLMGSDADGFLNMAEVIVTITHSDSHPS